MILNFAPRHGTNPIEEEGEGKEEMGQYWQIMNPGKSNVYYISLINNSNKKRSGNRKGQRKLGGEKWKKGQEDGQRKRNEEFCFRQH